MSNSELYEDETEIPTANHDDPDDAPDSRPPYLSWLGYSFLVYVLGAGASGALGVSALYIAIAPGLLGVTAAILVALDARQFDDWGGTKYVWALASVFPPAVLGYYVRRGMVTA